MQAFDWRQALYGVGTDVCRMGGNSIEPNRNERKKKKKKWTNKLKKIKKWLLKQNQFLRTFPLQISFVTDIKVQILLSLMFFFIYLFFLLFILTDFVCFVFVELQCLCICHDRFSFLVSLMHKMLFLELGF